jgi:hypothetical protein
MWSRGAIRTNGSVPSSGNTGFMLDCRSPTEHFGAGHRHFSVGEGLIKRLCLGRHDAPVDAAKASDWLCTPAAFGLML